MYIVIPKAGRGRRSEAREAEYQQQLDDFAAAIIELDSTLDFKVSARGWCYILEEHGLLKGDFSKVERLIVDLRKDGRLPLGITAEDGARAADSVEELDAATPQEEATDILVRAWNTVEYYTPLSRWEGQEFYLEMLVEKIDLKNLFEPVCSRYGVPITNARGWSDLHSRAGIMRRFQKQEARGKRCILLYCGDHDPGGLNIGSSLKSNFQDLAKAVGWSPDNLTVDRFGLNYDFIEENHLSWVGNLETASGRRLDDPKHPDHRKPYVQEYLARYGARKVEGNALVTRSEAGRALCKAAILRYFDTGADAEYTERLAEERNRVKTAFAELLKEAA
jgi:hypothetical protein